MQDRPGRCCACIKTPGSAGRRGGWVVPFRKVLYPAPPPPRARDVADVRAPEPPRPRFRLAPAVHARPSCAPGRRADGRLPPRNARQIEPACARAGFFLSRTRLGGRPRRSNPRYWPSPENRPPKEGTLRPTPRSGVLRRLSPSPAGIASPRRPVLLGNVARERRSHRGGLMRGRGNAGPASSSSTGTPVHPRAPASRRTPRRRFCLHRRAFLRRPSLRQSPREGRCHPRPDALSQSRDRDRGEIPRSRMGLASARLLARPLGAKFPFPRRLGTNKEILFALEGLLRLKGTKATAHARS